MNMGKAITQHAHNEINTTQYPGTRQLCDVCSCPTGHCGEDGVWVGDYRVCDDCYDIARKAMFEAAK